jgi:GNAT superfamily N-acetyltransferase
VAGLLDALSQTWPAKMGKGILDAMQLPGQVAGGLLQTQPSQPGMWSDVDEARQQTTQGTMMNRAADLGGMVMGGAYAAAPAIPTATGMGIRTYKPPSGVELMQKGPRSIDAYSGGRYAGGINISESNPFATSIHVEPEFRKLGLGKSLYSAAEKQIGEDLVPSPLGLSEEAKAFWRKELAAMPRETAEAVIARSREIGRGYGIKDADIDTRLVGLLP